MYKSKAFKLRIRPDITAKIYPGFPWMKHEDWLLRWQERRARENVEV